MPKISPPFKLALDRKCLIVLSLATTIAACRRTVRKGSAFPEAIAHLFFLRLSFRKKSLRRTKRKAIGIPHWAAASRNPISCKRMLVCVHSPSERHMNFPRRGHGFLLLFWKTRPFGRQGSSGGLDCLPSAKKRRASWQALSIAVSGELS